jgi:hypothetical protein
MFDRRFGGRGSGCAAATRVAAMSGVVSAALRLPFVRWCEAGACDMSVDYFPFLRILVIFADRTANF